MHHGVFKGKNAGTHSPRILILGESHHGDSQSSDAEFGIPASYTTESVIKDYLSSPSNACYRYFDKIANSFGFETGSADLRNKFWDNVYFGNYIDVLCGVKTSDAKNTLTDSNVEQYNRELFDFINSENISVVVCTSVLVYRSLPAFESKEEKKSSTKTAVGKSGNKNVYYRTCNYCAGTEHGNVPHLSHNVTICCIPHPSARAKFVPEWFSPFLKGLI